MKRSFAAYVQIKRAADSGACCQRVTNSNGNRGHMCKQNAVTEKDIRGYQFCSQHSSKFLKEDHVGVWERNILATGHG